MSKKFYVSAWRTALVFLSFWLVGVHSGCSELSPAFQVPTWSDGAAVLEPAFKKIESKLADVVARTKFESSSFSIQLTSNSETLWSHYHTAFKRNETRPGTDHVDGDSLFRIASISKTFTVLGVLYQHAAGNLSLDDPISKYLPDLEGDIPWKDITLRILASQLSGIPREFAQSDLVNVLPDPSAVGLPPATGKNTPTCDEYNHYIPCNRTDLMKELRLLSPLFAPNQKSTYSNVNFELLGLVLENVTGLDYKSYMAQAIFDPLKMTSTTLDKPSDKHAVLPVLDDADNYWDVDAGVQNPTGGIYSSATDMSKYVRYILTHYNTLATGVNWFMPASWSESLRSFYGMPWETFRTEKILRETNRPVTFVTKSGGLPGYYSKIFLLPEYGLGITALVGGSVRLLDEIQEIVTVAIVEAAEAAIWKEMSTIYDGTFVATDEALNSSVALFSSPSKGLVVKSFISNGTDVFDSLASLLIGAPDEDEEKPWHAQLTPTLLYKDEEAQEGEIWRFLPVAERTAASDAKVWTDFCTADVDIARYDGIPANQVVFWRKQRIVELPAWKLKMKAEPGPQDIGLVVQG